MNFPAAVRRPRLLCVDDDPNVVDAIALQLRKRFQVSTSTQPREVLAALASGEVAYDVVVSDLRMPEVSGVDLLRQIRLLAPATARILLTGYGDFSSAVAAVNEAAVHRFLTKPCRSDQLALAIDEALLAVADTTRELDPKIGKLATLGTMAGSIGHEVGNLVNALDGSIALVRAQVARGTLPSADEMSILETVKSRLADQANQLRSFARTKPTTLDRVDLDEVVRSGVRLLEIAGILHGVEVSYVPPPRPVHGYAVLSSLEGVIVNLVKNAAEAVAQRGDEEDDFDWSGRITIAVDGDDDTATIVVEDNGCGMPVEVKARVFESFFTTKPDGKGTGLGLAIASQTMRACGGTISVASEEGVFTRFTLALPRVV